ncbi:protein-L-isoaspartate O-methyltransferase family protein [Hyphomicrobium sp.]|uniref:protein-L-isoaspartate O-methyltransferase family protein n=1 Tax=Hyphomicrobium sp. TaxID=82 RepID=UPI002FDCB159
MDYEIQRKNMVESQVRPSDVTDRRIIRAMLDLPREQFVPERLKPLAYMDGAVPLISGAGHPRRSLLPPRTLAKLVQAAEIEPDATVLVIGAGTGYGAAVLAHLAQSVVALESDPELIGVARDALMASGVTNATLIEGPLTEGQPAKGPYDAILIEGAVDDIRPELLDQLKDGGRLVAIVGDTTSGSATVWRRDGSAYGRASVFDAGADVLPGFERVPAFAF